MAGWLKVTRSSLLSLTLVGCFAHHGRSDPAAAERAHDAGREAPDAGREARADAGRDAGEDAGVDAGVDAAISCRPAVVDLILAPPIIDVGETLPVGLTGPSAGCGCRYTLHALDETRLEVSACCNDEDPCGGDGFLLTHLLEPSAEPGRRSIAAHSLTREVTVAEPGDYDVAYAAARVETASVPFPHRPRAEQWVRYSGTLVRCGASRAYLRATSPGTLSFEVYDSSYECDGPQTEQPFGGFLYVGVLEPGTHRLSLENLGFDLRVR